MNIFCYSHHIADFRRDTSHLSHEQRGVYRDLLDAYYFNAGNLTCDLDQLARIISVQTQSERTALAGAVAEYFTTRNGRLRQKRADEEIDRIRDKSIKAKASAIAKHQKYNNKEPCVRTANGDANVVLTMNHEPLTIKEDTPPTPSEEKTPKPKVKKNARSSSQISDEFSPDLSGIALASELNIDLEIVRREFVDYWKSVGKPMCDWQATFRNRLRFVAKSRQERATREARQRQGNGSIVDAALRVGEIRSQRKS